MLVKTILLCEFGFYAYHRFIGHSFFSTLHEVHHQGGNASGLFRADEFRGALAMTMLQVAGPIRVHAPTYYAYMAALIAIHRVSHWEKVPHLLRYHAKHHLMHHSDPTVNFAIVTPLMDVLFGTFVRAR